MSSSSSKLGLSHNELVAIRIFSYSRKNTCLEQSAEDDIDDDAQLERPWVTAACQVRQDQMDGPSSKA